MKMVKSLILGSAAGLVAMSGAQAADLPVKAKAVEYVRICSLYGAGFFYIPGTDTCIKLGGYLRAETAFNELDVQRCVHRTGRRSEPVFELLHRSLSSRFDHRYAHRDRIRRGTHVHGFDFLLDHGFIRRKRGSPGLHRV